MTLQAVVFSKLYIHTVTPTHTHAHTHTTPHKFDDELLKALPVTLKSTTATEPQQVFLPNYFGTYTHINTDAILVALGVHAQRGLQ